LYSTKAMGFRPMSSNILRWSLLGPALSEE
jgi:hypothetical protein